jgi:hypothetical protein
MLLPEADPTMLGYKTSVVHKKLERNQDPTQYIF